MSREHVLVLLGVSVAIAPFVGLPLSWLASALPVFGALIAIIGVTLVSRRAAHHEKAPVGSTHE